jgi:hypothetical protein
VSKLIQEQGPGNSLAKVAPIGELPAQETFARLL